MLKKVSLNSDAIHYIVQQLSDGGTLAQYFLKLDLEKGFVHTFLPSDLSFQKITDYGESLEYLTGENVTREFNSLVKQEISFFLNQSPQRIAIFETLQSIHDSVVNKKHLQFFSIMNSAHDFVIDRKYDFFASGNEKELIEEYIADTPSYPCIIAITDIEKSNFSIVNRMRIDEVMASNLANKTEVLIIGAFDGEGFLIWQK